MNIKTGLLFCFIGLAGITGAQTSGTPKPFGTIHAPKHISVDSCDFKLLKVQGDAKTQVIQIELLMTNRAGKRKIFIDGNNSQFVSVAGDYFTIQKGFNVTDTELFTEVPIKTVCAIGKVSPVNTKLKLIAIKFGLNNGSVKWETLEFRDVPVEWN